MAPERLYCPYCNHDIRGRVETVWRGYGMNENSVTELTGFECVNDQCEASWKPDCSPNKPPRIPFV